VARDVIHAGVALLIEKPIAATLEEGRNLIALARQKGVLMTVGHIERFNPAIIAMKQRLEHGDLGHLFQVNVRRVGPFPSRIGDVGVVLDLATHDMDILRYLTAAEINRMHVELGRHLHSHHEDMISAILRFDNGIVGMLDINWLTPTKIRELSVVGERGMLVANYLTQDLYFYENDWCQDKHWPELAQMGVSEGQVIRLKVQRREPLYEELRAFCTSVRHEAPPAVRPEDALEALALAQQLMAAGNQPERHTLELAARTVGMPVYQPQGA
jgi:predicted dehydrogenase